MTDFMVLHKVFDGSEVMIRKSSVVSVGVYENDTIVDFQTGDNCYMKVKESYDEVKEMLLDG